MAGSRGEACLSYALFHPSARGEPLWAYVVGLCPGDFAYWVLWRTPGHRHLENADRSVHGATAVHAFVAHRAPAQVAELCWSGARSCHSAATDGAEYPAGLPLATLPGK